MNDKFTPGPWCVGGNTLHILEYNGGKGPYRLIAETNCKQCIDGSGNHTLTMEEAEGNARLIANAPTLFLALDEAINLLGKVIGNDDYRLTYYKKIINGIRGLQWDYNN